jgi:ParB family chromosome partitioning protein
VRETERLVRKMQEQGEKPAKPIAAEQDPDVKRLLNDLTERLGAKVDIKQSAKGKGKLVIAYNSLDELEGILAHIK